MAETGMSRRDTGTGAVARRADGRWQGSIRWMDDTGKARRSYVYGKTRPEVVAALRDASRRVEDGQAALDARTTVARYAQAWVAGHLAMSDRKATTREWTE